MARTRFSKAARAHQPQHSRVLPLPKVLHRWIGQKHPSRFLKTCHAAWQRRSLSRGSICTQMLRRFGQIMVLKAVGQLSNQTAIARVIIALTLQLSSRFLRQRRASAAHCRL